jgi:chemotaxis protein MotB
MKSRFLLPTAAMLTMFACVPQKNFSALEADAQKLQSALARCDSLRNTLPTESEAYLELKSDYLRSLQTIEQLRATNLNLNNSYQEILAQYADIINQNREILSATAQVQGNLGGQKSALAEGLEAQITQLQQLREELQQREQRILTMEENFRQAVLSRNDEILRLENELQARGNSLNQTQVTLNRSLENNVNNKELDISEAAGRIYITVSQDLLFGSGSAIIDAQGQKTLRAVAVALLQEMEMDILIEGHTDNSGSEDRNWSLSLDRAMAVSKVLQANGIPPARMTVAGRGAFAPVAANSTEAGRALNRRTEIILVPKSLTNASMQKY